MPDTFRSVTFPVILFTEANTIVSKLGAMLVRGLKTVTEADYS